jgi:hypothetical protein
MERLAAGNSLNNNLNNATRATTTDLTTANFSTPLQGAALLCQR